MSGQPHEPGVDWMAVVLMAVVLSFVLRACDPRVWETPARSVVVQATR